MFPPLPQLPSSTEHIEAFLEKQTKSKQLVPAVTQSEIQGLQNILRRRAKEQAKLDEHQREHPSRRPKMTPPKPLVELPEVKVRVLCRSIEGLNNMQQHAEAMFRNANVLNSAILAKMEIAQHANGTEDKGSILMEDELDFIEESIREDYNELLCIRKWVHDLVNGMSVVIADRAELTKDLKQCSRGTAQLQTVDKMEKTTLRLRMLHTSYRTLLESLPSAPMEFT